MRFFVHSVSSSNNYFSRIMANLSLKPLCSLVLVLQSLEIPGRKSANLKLASSFHVKLSAVSGFEDSYVRRPREQYWREC